MGNFINNSGGCQPSSGAGGEKTCVESTPQNSNPQASEQAMGTIYKILCLVTGKPYVGQTRQKLKRRIGQHKSKSKKATAGIDAAIAKYGFENFTVEVLEICPVNRLNEREIFFIAELDCKTPNGYNLTDGGKTTSGYSHTKETRDKISVKLKGRPSPNKGKPLSEEHKAKLSANHADFRGENHPFFGKHHSPETCAILSALNTGKKHTPEEIAKISASNKGKHSNKGRKHTPEEIAKISASVKATLAKKKLENGGNK